MDAVLLNSGGADCRLAAAIAKQAGYRLRSLFIDYNPLCAERAKASAQLTADLYCELGHEVVPFPTDLIGTYKNTKNIAFTRFFVHTIGCSYAVFHGYEALVTGAKPDCFPADWNRKFYDALTCSEMVIPPLLLEPVAEYMTMESVIAKANELGVPLDDTCSCGCDDPATCTCSKCLQRDSVGLPRC